MNTLTELFQANAWSVWSCNKDIICSIFRWAVGKGGRNCRVQFVKGYWKIMLCLHFVLFCFVSYSVILSLCNLKDVLLLFLYRILLLTLNKDLFMFNNNVSDFVDDTFTKNNQWQDCFILLIYFKMCINWSWSEKHKHKLL